MTYTVAEAERILAEAKAREAEVDYEVWRPAFEKWLIEETGIDPDCLSEPSLEWKAFYAGLAAIRAERKRAGGVRWPGEAELREIIEYCWTDKAEWTADRILARLREFMS